ncbi:MAG: LLM class flavin-dependent oxidoreductase [Chloroflexi bacterium]|nr:LLM class flavin-dependent oxidoreductase [Chloroflexota bacterium]
MAVQIEFRKSCVPASAEQCIRFAEELERLGYSGFWYPHAVSRQMPILETLSVLTAVAARTSRIRIGTAVLQTPLYQPFALAQTLMTIDHFSNGRLVCGLGLGWVPSEFENLGVPFKERGGRTDEALEIIRRLWTEDEVTFAGKYYTLREARLIPKPIQRPYPKILIGGGYNAGARGYPGEKPRPRWVEAPLRRTAKYADGWVAPPYLSPDEAVEAIGEGLDRIKALGREMGRTITDEEFEIVVETAPFNVSESRERAVEEAARLHSARSVGDFHQVMGNLSFERQLNTGGFGPPEEVAAFVDKWLDVARRAPALKSIQLNIGSLDPLEQIRRFHEQVRPLLRI